MTYLNGDCQQFKSIIKFTAAVYVSLLYAVSLGSTVQSESEVVKDLIFTAGCIFTFSSINMYYRSLQSGQSNNASVVPESVLNEESPGVVVHSIVEEKLELEQPTVEAPPSFAYQMIAVTRVVCGGLSSAYRGGIASLIMVTKLGFTGSAEVISGIGFMLVFTLAKFPHFTGTPITRNERILIPIRVISSSSSALIASQLVPRVTPVVMLLSQCAFSASVFIVEYHSDRRRIFNDQIITSWEKILIAGVSIFYGLVATPDKFSLFSKLNASNVVLSSANCAVLSWVFFRHYHYTIEPPASRSTALEAELVESPSPSPPLILPG